MFQESMGMLDIQLSVPPQYGVVSEKKVHEEEGVFSLNFSINQEQKGCRGESISYSPCFTPQIHYTKKASK